MSFPGPGRGGQALGVPGVAIAISLVPPLAVALSIIVVTEIRKAVRRRTTAEAGPAAHLPPAREQIPG